METHTFTTDGVEDRKSIVVLFTVSSGGGD